MIRVLLVDDQHLVREGFARLLRDVEDVEVVGEAADGTTAVELARQIHPDVVLMDVRMPGMDGVEATALIGPGPTHGQSPDIDDVRPRRGSAPGPSSRRERLPAEDTPYDQLIHAIRVVAHGDAVLAPSVTRRLIESFSPSPAVTEEDDVRLGRLTQREREVLALVARGMSNAEIGKATFLSEATVETHVGRVLGKLGCRDRVQAVVFAFRTGFASRI